MPRKFALEVFRSTAFKQITAPRSLKKKGKKGSYVIRIWRTDNLSVVYIDHHAPTTTLDLFKDRSVGRCQVKDASKRKYGDYDILFKMSGNSFPHILQM